MVQDTNKHLFIHDSIIIIITIIVKRDGLFDVECLRHVDSGMVKTKNI